MSVNIQEQYDKIYRYCYYKVGNSTLAEDLTQETFLRYFAQDSYIERGKQLAYLYTIARNLCTDAFRQKQPEELSDDVPDPDSFKNLEVSIVIQQALKMLTEQERELLLFRYVNELSFNEMAAILGISRFSAYRRTNSALSALKALFREEDFL